MTKHLPGLGSPPALGQKPGYLAICLPLVGNPHIEFTAALSNMYYQLGVLRAPTCLIRSTGSVLPNSRNNCLKMVEEIEAKGTTIEWVLFIDGDMTFPQNMPLRLLQHKKDIVGCTYLRRTPPYDVHGKGLSGKPERMNEGLIEVAALPTGCLLIRREVFRKFKKPIFRFVVDEANERTFGEDYTFCTMARDLGYKIWLDVDLSKLIGHVSEKVLYPDAEGWDGVQGTPEYQMMRELRAKELDLEKVQVNG